MHRLAFPRSEDPVQQLNGHISSDHFSDLDFSFGFVAWIINRPLSPPMKSANEQMLEGTRGIITHRSHYCLYLHLGATNICSSSRIGYTQAS